MVDLREDAQLHNVGSEEVVIEKRVNTYRWEIKEIKKRESKWVLQAENFPLSD